MSADGSGRGGGFGFGLPVFDYEMEHSKVEAWLDEHPEFFQVEHFSSFPLLWAAAGPVEWMGL
jgi:hypothetical protein